MGASIPGVSQCSGNKRRFKCVFFKRASFYLQGILVIYISREIIKANYTLYWNQSFVKSPVKQWESLLIGSPIFSN
jgi:hypothetical protein